MNNKSKLLINVPRADGTTDAIHYKKDCPDFECLEDGTIMRECKYCNLSFVCRQVDIVNGQTIPMESHYLPIKDPVTGEDTEWEYFCTGMHDIRPLIERKEDDKAS